MPNIKCIMEIRPLVRSVVFYLTNCPTTSPGIVVKGREVCVFWENYPYPFDIELPFTLLEDSIRSVTVSPDGVSFCVRTVELVVRQPDDNPREFYHLDLHNSTQYSLKCVQCKSDLTDSTINFKLIFPLPSNRWKSASGDWFCHQPAEGASAAPLVPNKLLEPKPQYCFTDTFFKFIHKSLLDSSKVAKSEKTYSCAKCSQEIGHKEATETALLWNDTVMWKTETRPGCEGDAIQFLVSHIHQTIKKTPGLPKKILLCTKFQPKRYLYVWLVDEKLTVLNNLGALQELVFRRKGKLLEKENPKATLLSRMTLFKVFYSYIVEEDKAKVYKENDLVEELTISTKGIQALKRHFDNTGALVPANDRVSQGYSIAYLPRI